MSISDAEQGVEADEAWSTSERRSLAPVLGGRLEGGVTDWRWANLMVASLKRLRETDACIMPFVDFEVIPDFTGKPDGMFAWFICDTRVLKEQFRESALASCTDALRGIAVAAGFPGAAAATLMTDVTSLEDIEAGGGRFYFFR